MIERKTGAGALLPGLRSAQGTDMRHSVRIATFVAAFGLVAAACTSGGSSPSNPPATPASAAPTQTDSPSATQASTLGPTTAPTATPAPSLPPATAAPTGSGIHLSSFLPIHPSFVIKPSFLPLFHGQYLLYDTDKSLPGDVSQPQEWVVKPDGSGARLVAEGIAVGPLSPPRFNLDAVWSHNGLILHLARYQDACTPHLSDVPASGGTETPKVTMTNHDGYFLWSPDDTRIAYRHYHEDTICEQNGLSMINDLIVMNADGSGKHIIRTNIPYQVTAWLPDGSGFVAHNDAGAWFKVNGIDGSTTPLGVTAGRLEVSPDGSKIAYQNGAHLYARNFSGGPVRDMGVHQDFAWAPTGPVLAICTSSQLSSQSANSGVGLILYSGGCTSPSWSPDGKTIAFHKSTGWIAVVSSTGGAATNVATTSKAIEVDWQP
jgi:hypothetical protein